MFALRDFLKQGFLNAVGNLPDYKIILNAAGWLEKDVLTEDDLEEIQTAIAKKNQPTKPEEPEAEELKEINYGDSGTDS